MKFELSKEQVDELIEWQKRHKTTNCGAIGGRYTYSFTPTSVGTIVEVKDAITKDFLDITDYLGF